MLDKQRRRLAAIMFTDIAGYTAMMRQDETAGLAKVRRYRSVLDRLVAEHDGEILRHYGDGSLSLFNSAVEVVRCARKIQEAMQETPKVPLRVGMHIGDVILEDEEIYGDGVNLASRIESLGQPGTVFFSKSVYEKIRSLPEFEITSLGTFAFKNVDESTEVFALAHAKLGFATAMPAIQRLVPWREVIDDTERSAEVALSLDSTLAEGHHLLGVINLFYKWDWEAAHANFERSRKLNPFLADAYIDDAFVYLACGEAEKAIVLAEKALKLDSLNLDINWDAAVIYLHSGNNVKAKEIAYKLMEIYPNNSETHFLSGHVFYYGEKNYVRAAESYRRSLELAGGKGHSFEMLAKSLVKTGKEQEARKMLEQLHRTAEEEYVTPFSFMQIYASLGEMDKAFSYLDQCFEERTNWLIGLNLPAYYEDLRHDSRFEEYVERMNFPE